MAKLIRRVLTLLLVTLLWGSQPAWGAEYDYGRPHHSASFPHLRGTVGMSVGYVWPIGAEVRLSSYGDPHPLYSIGIGLDLQSGVQLTEWLAFDINAAGETMVFFGDGRVGGLFEVSPIRSLALSAGAAIGGLYHYFDTGTQGVGYAVGLLRAEHRWPDDEDRSSVTTIGGEALLGSTVGGSMSTGGKPTIGARFIMGWLFR